MVCVDRIVSSSCFEPANGFGCAAEAAPPPITAEMIECRICQEEGEERDMEAPCACNGTLKFAHRKCIQRWCNKKGDITCEICNQIYSPNYSCPPIKASSDVMVIDIRQNWGSGIDVHDSRYFAMATADPELLHVNYEDYMATSSGFISSFRSVALVLMFLLLFHHVLLIARDPRGVQVQVMVSLLQFLVFLVPCYVAVCSCYNMISRRRPLCSCLGC